MAFKINKEEIIAEAKRRRQNAEKDYAAKADVIAGGYKTSKAKSTDSTVSKKTTDTAASNSSVLAQIDEIRNTLGIKKSTGTTTAEKALAANNPAFVYLQKAGGATGGIKKGSDALVKGTASNIKSPVQIAALGAGDYSASNSTRFDKVANAAISGSASGYKKLAADLTSSTGNLSMGESARAAINGVSQQEAEAEKRERANNGWVGDLKRSLLTGADESAARAYAYEQQAKEGLGTFGQGVVDFGIAGLQFAGDAALNAIAPGTGLAAMAGRAYGSASQQAKEMGLSEGEQQLSGLKSAAIEVLTEKLFGSVSKVAYGKGIIKNENLVNSLVNRLAKTDKGRTALKVLVGANEEGLEEVLSDILNPIADRVLKLDDGKGDWSDLAADFDTQQMLEDYIIGAALGLVGAGTNVVSGQYKAENAQQRAYEDYQKQLVNAGLATEQGGTAQTTAEKYKSIVEQSTQRGKRNLSDKETKNLETLIRGTYAQEDASAVNSRLAQLGTSANEQTVNAIVKAVNGETLTRAEQKAFNANPYSQRVVNEMTDTRGVTSNEWYTDRAQGQSYTPEKSSGISTERTQTALNETEAAENNVSENLAKRYGISQSEVERTYALNKSASPQAFETAFSAMYQMGRNGASRAMIGDIPALTKQQADIAYQMGAASRYFKNEGVNSNEIHLRNVAERTGGQNTGGQVRGVAESAGGNVAGAGRSGQGSYSTVQGKAGEQVVYNGTAQKNVYYYAGEETEDMKKGRELIESYGYKVAYFVGGNIQVEDGSVRGVVDTANKTVLVRADHPDITALQIARHEMGHAAIAKGDFTLAELRERLLKDFTDAEIDEMVEVYSSAYSGILSAEEAFEEICCDALGKINIFAGTKQNSASYVKAQRNIRKYATEKNSSKGRAPPETGGVKYSISEVVGDDQTNYGIGVHLDSTLLENLTPKERTEMVKERVKELGGEVFTAYDSTGKAVVISIATPEERFKSRTGKTKSVNKDLTTKYIGNETKQEAVVLLDELIETASFDASKNPTHPHDWLDNNGKNNWDYWTTYVQDKNGAIWEATLNIANATDGRKILYDIGPIKKAGQSVKSDTSLLSTGQSVKSDTSAVDNSIRSSEENVKHNYSLEPVKAIQPQSGEWERGSTTDEVRAKHPDLWAVDAESSESRNPTQISGTVKSYRKIYDALKAEDFDGTVLDASSGLGYGTRAGIEEYGFNVEDIEPFPDNSYKPKYTDYSKLHKKYDVIISNAVLNVLPQDQRDALVVKMGQMLNDGGRMFINVRGTDVRNASSKVAIDDGNMEYYISNTGSYQKGFTKKELVAYLQDALGDGYTVTGTNKFGAVSAVVKKNTAKTAEKFSREAESDRYIVALDDANIDELKKSLTLDKAIDLLDAQTGLSYRLRSSDNPMSRAGYAMFADNIDSLIGAYGGSRPKAFSVEISALTPVSDIVQDIIDARHRTDEKTPWILEDHEHLSDEEFAALFDPDDIVDSAAAYDDEDLVSWLRDNVLEPKDIIGLETYDGAIAFDTDIIKRNLPAEVTSTQFDPGEVKYSRETTSSIKQQIKNASDKFNAMDIVAKVKAPDLSKMNIKQQRQWAESFLKNTGYAVDRNGFGKIEFTPKHINEGLNYVKSPSEIAAFAALPKVLKRGVEIDSHTEHKGRQRDSVTIAAPVEINGVRGNMAVVVTITSKNHYHAHRIVLPNGGEFTFNIKEVDPKPAEAAPNAESSPIESTSKVSVTDNAKKVKTSREPETLNELRRQNKVLRERVDYWKRQTKPTKVKQLRMDDIRRLAKEVVEMSETDLKPKDITEGLTELGKYLLNEPELRYTDVSKMAEDIATDVIENATAIVNEEDTAIHNELRDYLKRVKLRDDGSAEFESIRSSYKRRIMFDKKGLGVDTAYAELHDMFGEGYFPEDIINPADQLERIAEVLDNTAPKYANPNGYYAKEATEFLRNYIIDSMLGEDMRQSAPTYADKAEAKLAAAKAQGAQRLNKQKAEYDEKISNIKEQNEKYIKKAITEERQRGEKRLQRFRDSVESRDAKRKETAEKNRYKAQIEKNVKTLSDWLLKPDHKNALKHISGELQSTVRDFIASINFTSARQLGGGAATAKDMRYLSNLERLHRYITDKNVGEDRYSGYLDLPPNFETELGNFIHEVNALARKNSGYTINDMTVEQLKELSDIVKTMKKTITDMNRMYQNRTFQHAYDAGASDVATLKGYVRTKAFTTNLAANRLDQTVMWEQSRPAHVFRRFGKGGESIYREFADAQGTMAFLTKEVLDFANKAYKSSEVKAWAKETHTFKFGDDAVTLTTAQLMSLYELNKRKQAKQHLDAGGFRVANFKNGRFKLETDKKSHAFTDIELGKMFEKLTDRQKEVADKLQRFMVEKGGAWGNYVSIKRFDVEMFKDENYFPIKVDNGQLDAKETESVDNASLYQLLNMGFAKDVSAKANQALVVYDIFDVFANHMSEMAQYRSFALPVLDAMKWFNYKERNESGVVTASFREEMRRAFGSDVNGRGFAEKFITGVIKAYNGAEGRGENTYASKSLNLMNRQAVAYNTRVMIQQPSAIVRAAMFLNPADLAASLKNYAGITTKANIEEMHKYSGVAVWKDLGFYDVNVSRGVRELIKNDQGVISRVNEVGMKGAEFADKVTWAALWDASKKKVRRETGLNENSEEFYAKVSELFEDVIYNTQVVDTVLTKSEYSRDKRFSRRLFSSFMSEPMTTASLVTSEIFDIQMKQAAGEKLKLSDYSRLSKTCIVVAVAAAVNSALAALADAWRDDDDYGKFGDKWLRAFRIKLADELMPLTYLPYSSTVWDTFKLLLDKMEKKWFGLDVYGNGTDLPISDVIEATTKVVEIFKEIDEKGESSKYTKFGGYYKVVNVISKLTGVPIYNLMREIVTVNNNLRPDNKWRSYEPSAENSVYYAWKDGYLSNDEALDALQDMGDDSLDADKAYLTLEKWKANAKPEYFAVYDAIDNDGDIRSAVKDMLDHGKEEGYVKSAITNHYKDAYINGDNAERVRIRKALYATGLYGSVNDVIEKCNSWLK